MNSCPLNNNNSQQFTHVETKKGIKPATFHWHYLKTEKNFDLPYILLNSCAINGWYKCGRTPMFQHTNIIYTNWLLIRNKVISYSTVKCGRLQWTSTPKKHRLNESMCYFHHHWILKHGTRSLKHSPDKQEQEKAIPQEAYCNGKYMSIVYLDCINNVVGKNMINFHLVQTDILAQ